MIPKGDSATYGKVVAEGDMKTLDELRNRGNKNGVYYPEYVSSSKPMRFDEEDNEDNTWV